MYNKLLSLHIACGLLLATSVAFGMKEESSNPEQQLYLAVNYANGEKWNFFDKNGNAVEGITRNNIKTTLNSNHTLEYNETQQTLSRQTDKVRFSLKNLKLSNTQIDIARAVIGRQESNVYVNTNNTLILLSNLRKISYTEPRSGSYPDTGRANSATHIATKNNTNDDNAEVQPTMSTQNTLDTILNGTLAEFTTPEGIQTETSSSAQVESSNKEKDHMPALAALLVKKTLEKSNDVAKVSDTKENDKKSSSRLSNYCIAGGVVISIGVLITAYFLKYPDKFAQLLQSARITA